MDLLRRKFDSSFMALQVWMDALAIWVAWFVGRRIHESWALDGGEMPDVGLRVLLILVVGVTLLCFWGCDMYKWRKSILNVEEYRAAFFAVLLSCLINCALLFLLGWGGPAGPFAEPAGAADDYRSLLPVVFGLVYVFTVLERSFMFHLLSALHARGFGNTNLAIYGTGDLARRVQQKLKLFPILGYRLVGFLDDGVTAQSFQGVPLLGGRRDLPEVRRRYGIKQILVAKAELEQEELVDLCSQLDNQGISYQVVPRLFHFFAQRFKVENLDSIPLISLSAKAKHPFYRFVKRGMDVAASIAILAALSWFFLIVALLIKRESEGPVFFSQERIGYRGRKFRMFKFRTMYLDMCGDEPAPRRPGDPRVTRTGRWLRSTSLDELPQLYNVLRGEMSLVGPRPEMPFIVEGYTPVQALRLDAKPGITGLWQVSEARHAPIHENLDYDLYYIENQSLFLDLVILLLTAPTVLRTRGL